MEEFSSPTNTGDFVGNAQAVKALQTWIRENIENPNHPKRFCFLTGSTGCGKSILARLILKEAGYTVREFLASDMRIKSGRQRLLQYLSFRDVLAMIEYKNKEQNSSFRKAAIIECIENMGLATQELYRDIRTLFKKKITKGVPIIFMGTAPFKGKRPLNQHSVFIHMRPKVVKEIGIVLVYILEKWKREKGSSPLVEKLLSSKEEQLELSEKCGGDVRRLIKFLEYLNLGSQKTDVDDVVMQMHSHEMQGPMSSLYRIIQIKKSRTPDQVLLDVSIEGLRMPFGIHGVLLDYVPWLVKQKYKKFSQILQNKIIAKVLYELMFILSDFCILQGISKVNQLYEVEEEAMFISTWGCRTILLGLDKIADEVQKEKTSNVNGFKKPTIRWCGNTTTLKHWWVDLEKGTKHGDESVDVPCMSKTLRTHANRHIRLNTWFDKVRTHTSPYAWTPYMGPYTLQLLRARSGIYPPKDKVLKIGYLLEK